MSLSEIYMKLRRLVDKIPLWFHILGAVLGALGGIAGGCILSFYFKNIHAGVWCFLSAVAALFLLHLLLLHRYKNLAKVHTVKSLDRLKIGAVVVVVICSLSKFCKVSNFKS